MCQAVQRLNGLVSATCFLCPWVEPNVDTCAHVRKHLIRNKCTSRKQAATHHEETDALGCHPQHHNKQGEEQQRGAEVFLEHHHNNRHCPRHKNGSKVTQLRQCDAENANVSLHDELSAFCEICSEENGQKNFCELARLEVDGPDAHPNARTTTGETKTRNQRQQQQRQTSSK
ncbi:unannotated protein [freshwater metagenome]|uniref:Unannotated protein n=1 Tax=freshwater metagenome TaxID=449393 RepID=A0A6J6NUS3_9ZZZZ